MSVLESVKIGPTIAYSPLLKRYKLEEFFELPELEDRSHYELIEGVLKIVPPPKFEHGELVSFMTELLVDYLLKNERPGKVYHPRESIYLENIWGTYLEPDMMYVSNELRETMGNRRTSADIVFEFLSERTATYDRTEKADTYLALGIKELWLVDSDNETVEVRNAEKPNDNLSWETRIYQKKEIAVSKILTDWKVSVSELFAAVQAKY